MPDSPGGLRTSSHVQNVAVYPAMGCILIETPWWVAVCAISHSRRPNSLLMDRFPDVFCILLLVVID